MSYTLKELVNDRWDILASGFPSRSACEAFAHDYLFRFGYEVVDSHRSAVTDSIDIVASRNGVFSHFGVEKESR